MARIAVSGGGYVGLVTAACLAELGHDVTCIEIEPRRLHALTRGELPIYEPRLDGLVEGTVAAGRLRFTGDYAEAIPDADFAFIAVQTPPMDDGTADTRFIFQCLDSMLPFAPYGLRVVVKSTVPVGTNDALTRFLVESGRGDMAVVSNPEFLRQGSAVMDFLQPDRVVVGSADQDAAVDVAALYSTIAAPMVIVGQRSAELGKYGANALLATRISFMNEVAAVCEAFGADIEEVTDIMRLDPRIGPHYLRAGLGWGGSCFPKDVRALAALAKSGHQNTPIIDAAYEVNQHQREAAYQKIRMSLNGHLQPVVGVLGLAFKPDTDDLRQSPAIEIVARLLQDGVRIQAHDPVAMDKAREVLPQIEYCCSPIDVTVGADVAFLATEWRQYQDIDWGVAAENMRNRVVLDGRNVLDPARMMALGYTYLSFGRSNGTTAHSNGNLLREGDMEINA